jgi:hypothetical protein
MFIAAIYRERRPMRTWKNNIRMDLREIECEVVYWIYMAQYRDHWLVVVNTAIKFGEFLD